MGNTESQEYRYTNYSPGSENKCAQDHRLDYDNSKVRLFF